MPADLQGRRAVVTAGARGIGRAIAMLLIRAGAKVTVVDKDATALSAAFEHETCHLVPADLSRKHVRLAEQLVSDGPFELIVNNVGVNNDRDFLSLRPSDYDTVMNTNLRGPFFFTQRLVREFADAQARGTDGPRRGSILFVSSLHERSHGADVPYGISKAGVTTTAKNLAKQLGPLGIRVNAISPGWIRTAARLDTPEQVAKQARFGPRVPLGRPGFPDDVARVALFLLSDAWSGYVTAQNIDVDGGLSLFNFRDGG
jgi:NAD(P)-dependent dehydrogenase (short-subunit alcohol dehydrogenase family)